MISLVGKLVCTNFGRNRNSDHQFLHQLSHLEINEQRSYYILGKKAFSLCGYLFGACHKTGQ